MSQFLDDLRDVWSEMLQPPWQRSVAEDVFKRRGRWRYWLIGWVWVLGGLALGALGAATLVQAMGLEVV